jgi:hypothetical protein
MKSILSTFGKIAVNDATFTPRPFDGSSKDPTDVTRWIDRFEQYTAFRNIAGEERRQLFLLLMIGTEGDWIKTLPPEITNDYEKLLTEFKKRHALTPVDIWRKTIGLWSRFQGVNETCDDYISAMQLIANTINLPEDQLCSAIIKGLRAEIQLFCLQSGATTLALIKAAARISEAAQEAQKTRAKEYAPLQSTPAQIAAVGPPQTSEKSTSTQVNRGTRNVSFDQQEPPKRQNLDPAPTMPRRDYDDRQYENQRNNGSDGRRYTDERRERKEPAQADRNRREFNGRRSPSQSYESERRGDRPSTEHYRDRRDNSESADQRYWSNSRRNDGYADRRDDVNDERDTDRRRPSSSERRNHGNSDRFNNPRYVDFKCFNCGLYGHISRFCEEPRSQPYRLRGYNNRPDTRDSRESR